MSETLALNTQSELQSHGNSCPPQARLLNAPPPPPLNVIFTQECLIKFADDTTSESAAGWRVSTWI